jgi:hypothetical protein
VKCKFCRRVWEGAVLEVLQVIRCSMTGGEEEVNILPRGFSVLWNEALYRGTSLTRKRFLVKNSPHGFSVEGFVGWGTEVTQK